MHDKLITIFTKKIKRKYIHSAKLVRTQSSMGPYSVRMRENADQETSVYGHLLRSARSKNQSFLEVSTEEINSECIFNINSECILNAQFN